MNEKVLTPYPDDTPTRVRVYVGQKKSAGAPPATLWVMEAELPRRDARAIHDELESIVRTEPRVYVLSVNEGRFSWGADGGHTLDVVLFLGQSFADGILAALTVDLFRRLFLKQREKGLWPEGYPSDFTREYAISYARWVIGSRYGMIADSMDPLPDIDDELEIVSESEDLQQGEWNIALKDRNGAIYRITFGFLDGVPTAYKIEREVP
ncbi:hypothetical protein ABGB12_27940 [Actinocorallia sp. B10E7]|uniref:hypothetical protein n=1 Tax=Actinocorallia sp. B10E7 TaxID=3153558 RepID=UPI00325F04EB